MKEIKEGSDEGHPRTYGATDQAKVDQIVKNGTSPHLRGNRQSTRGEWESRRDIPAPTGQPHCSSSPRSNFAGHPRTYGATPGAVRGK